MDCMAITGNGFEDLVGTNIIVWFCVCRLADHTSYSGQAGSQNEDHADPVTRHPHVQQRQAQQQQPPPERRPQHAQQAQQQPQEQVAQAEPSGAALMAEALGRLCQAASSSGKRSRAASPTGSSTSHTSTSRHARHAHAHSPVPSAHHLFTGDTSSSRHAGVSSSKGDDRPTSAGHTAKAQVQGHSAAAKETSSLGSLVQSVQSASGQDGSPGAAGAGSNASQLVWAQQQAGSGSGCSPDAADHEASSSGGTAPVQAGGAAEGTAGVTAGGTAGMLAALQRLDAQPGSQHDTEAQAAGAVHSTSGTGEQVPDAQQRLLTHPRSLSQLQSEEEQDCATAVGSTAESGPGTSPAGDRAAAESGSPSASASRASDASQQASPTAGASVGSSQAASTSGSPVTPAATGSFRSVVARVIGLDAAELQSPNKRKYGRSESRDAGVRISDHSVGESP